MDGIIVINLEDNVGNAIMDIKKGEMVSFISNNATFEIEAKEDIKYGFKMAIKDIKSRKPVIKYGEIIGEANKNIAKGELVHIHNMEGRRGRGDL